MDGGGCLGCGSVQAGHRGPGELLIRELARAKDPAATLNGAGTTLAGWVCYLDRR
jgi:hypothetical protein